MPGSLRLRRLSALAFVLPGLAACGGDDNNSGFPDANLLPAYISAGLTAISYDGTTDDLLTAGLGRTGLAGAAPTIANPAAPTAVELRKLAIHTNYRAVLDITANGGYGTLYGPNVASDGTVGTGEGRIAGTEYIAFADDGTGSQNVTLMVQVPSTFNRARPCIVTGTSSGSRGIYGAIGSSGEWGLKRGCAVAYADKGTGSGVHDLQNNTVNRIDGTRGDAAAVGRGSTFTARLTDTERTAFNTATPNRFAVKHAHSEQNPEKDWGRDTLRAVEFAFYAINQSFGDLDRGQRLRTFKPENTIVIASSISNGGGAAVAAAEQDTGGLIDGVAVTEPNVQLPANLGLSIVRGTRPAYTGGSKPLYDYFTYANLLQPCAALAAGAAGSPFAFALGNLTAGTNRCTALAANGLVTGATTQAQADDALARLRAYGWEPEADVLHASHYLFATPAIAVTYSNAHGRFRVSDNLCGYSFGAVDGTGAPVAAGLNGVAQSFGTGNGVPPSTLTRAGELPVVSLQLINNDSVGGPRSHAASVSASTMLADFSYDAGACQRALWTGTTANATRVKNGIAEAYRNANLRGKPAIIVHGRADTLVPVNFSSRPYFARNQQVEGAASRLRYIEVTNAQHFDAFLGFAGYDNRFVPLHVYFNRALDAMWNHLTAGAALPPSQVVRATPRGGTAGAAPAITGTNVPAIAAAPAVGDQITFSGSTLTIPE